VHLWLVLALALAAAEPTLSEAEQSIWTLEIRRSAPASFEAWTDHESPEIRGRTALALGRLQDPASLPWLEELVADPDPAVRAQAAFGLGLTPESAELLRARLLAERDDAVRARLVAALGLAADPADEVLFARALDAGPLEAAEAAEAAIALGRLGLAEPEHVFADTTLIALARQLRRLKPRARHAAAFALARIGTPRPPPEVRRTLQERATDDADPVVRAWSLRALSAAETGEEGMRLAALAARDEDVGVRAAAARYLGKLDVTPARSTLDELLADGDWGVRLETVRAIGAHEALDHDALLRPVLEGPDPELAAAALGVLLAVGVERSTRPWLSEDQPLELQAAAVASLDQPRQLARLAVHSEQALLRTTAAGTLMELEGALAYVDVLLESEDTKVVAVAASLLAEAVSPEPASIDRLAERLAETDDLDLLTEGFGALAVWHAAAQPLPEGLDQVVAGALTHPGASVRAAAAPLAEALELPPPPPMDPVATLPLLSDVQKARSARILTDVGELRVTLRPDLAPLTVWNFATLADEDYFDGLHFHRVVPDFVIQDGCPRGDGWGDPGHQIPDELSWLPYDEGTLGMALSGPDTGGSQWFITLSPQPHLEASYTVFGQISLDNGAAAQVRVGTVIEDVVIERVGW